jgi:hypothetical protein
VMHGEAQGEAWDLVIFTTLVRSMFEHERQAI